MKKKQKLIRMVCVFLVFAVLLAGYFVVTKLTAVEEEEETTDDTFVIHSLDKNEINKITYLQEKEEIVLEQKGEEWICRTDEKCPVNEFTVSAMLDSLKEVKAYRKIQGADIDREMFGLEDPSQVVTFTLKDGKEYVFTLGVLNEAVDKYYFQMPDDENVYLIDTTMYNKFDYSLLDLADVEEYPAMGNRDIAEFVLERKGKTLYFVDKQDAAHKKNETEIPECEWMYGSDKKNLKELEEEKASALVQAILNLSNSECITYNKTEEDFKTYGLDRPSLKLTFHYTTMELEDEEKSETSDSVILDHTFTMHVGDTDEKTGEYYVWMEGSECIYTMNVSNINKMMAMFEE